MGNDNVDSEDYPLPGRLPQGEGDYVTSEQRTEPSARDLELRREAEEEMDEVDPPF